MWIPRSFTPLSSNNAAHGVWHAADPDLQTGAILDFSRNPPRNCAVDLARLRIGQFRARLMIALNDEIDLADVHAVVFAEHVRHLTIDLDDHQLRAFDDRPLPHIRRAKVEVPAVVHRASLKDDDIHGIEKAPVIIRHLSQIQRHVVATAGVVLSAVVGRKMPAEHVEMLAFRIFFDHRAWTHRQAGANLDVLQFVFSRSQRLIENIGLAKRRAVVQPHAGFDEAGSLFRGDRFSGHGRPLQRYGGLK